MESLRVRDVMAHGVPTCSPFATVEEVRKIMVSEGKPFLVVTDETGEMWGIITEMILLKNLGKSLTAEEIMASPVITISPFATLEEARRVMVEKNVHHLIVEHASPENPLTPVGYISSSQVIKNYPATF